jgi:hypothetical protein
MHKDSKYDTRKFRIIYPVAKLEISIGVKRIPC